MSQSEPTTVKEVVVRNYKPVDEHSEETVAFTAQIRLDGRAVGTVRHHGTGSAHRYEFQTRSDHEAFLPYAESWARPNGLTDSPADALIDQLCEDYQLTNEARALLKLRTNLLPSSTRTPGESYRPTDPRTPPRGAASAHAAP